MGHAHEGEERHTGRELVVRNMGLLPHALVVEELRKGLRKDLFLWHKDLLRKDQPSLLHTDPWHKDLWRMDREHRDQA